MQAAVPMRCQPKKGRFACAFRHCHQASASSSRAPYPPTQTNMSSVALARLRQGQGRCTQQLLSLVQWHQQQSAAAAAGGAQRGLADQAAAVQFAKERKGFENNLGELRKQWAKEREEREAAKAAAEAEARCAAAAAACSRLRRANVGCPVLLFILLNGCGGSTLNGVFYACKRMFSLLSSAPQTCAPLPVQPTLLAASAARDAIFRAGRHVKRAVRSVHSRTWRPKRSALQSTSSAWLWSGSSGCVHSWLPERKRFLWMQRVAVCSSGS